MKSTEMSNNGFFTLGDSAGLNFVAPVVIALISGEDVLSYAMVAGVYL